MQLDRIRESARRVAESEGLELVHVEWAGSWSRGVLRILIDRPDEGISLAHCQAVSEQMSAILDAEDLIAGSYVLEVASPGLDRRLYSPADYDRFRGRRVQVCLRRRSEDVGAKRFEAHLGEQAGGMVNFDLGEKTVRISFEEIATVSLVVEL